MINTDDSGRRISSAPRSRMCHICGRQYGVHSFGIHLKQCKDLWISREALKEKSERKILPPDPSGDDEADLEELNRLANEIYNTVSLSTCAYCGRSFLTERLILHNRSCTFDNPGKRAPTRVELSAEDIERKEFERKEVERKELLKVAERKPKPQWNLRRTMSSGSTYSDTLGRRSPNESRDNPCSSGEAVTERVRTSTYDSSTISSSNSSLKCLKRLDIKGNISVPLARVGSTGKIHQEASFNPRTRSGASTTNARNRKESDSPDKGMAQIVVEPDVNYDFSCSPGACSVLNDISDLDSGGKYNDGYDYVIDNTETESQAPIRKSDRNESPMTPKVKSRFDDGIEVGNEIEGMNEMMNEHEFASTDINGDRDTYLYHDVDNTLKNKCSDRKTSIEEHKCDRENEIEINSKDDRVEKNMKNEENKVEKYCGKKDDTASLKQIYLENAVENTEIRNASKITEMESTVADLRETINEMKSLIKELKTKENAVEKAKCLCMVS